MHQLDTLVLDHPTEVLDDPLVGRHRAAPPAARRALRRIAVSAVALLVVAMVGWFTADAVGLTRADVTRSVDLPVGSVRPEVHEPRPGRTVDITTRPTPAPVEPPAPDAVSSAPEAGTVSPTIRAPQPTVEPSPVRMVKVGDPCSSPGAAGVTAKGKRAVCTAGGGPTRWKHV